MYKLTYLLTIYARPFYKGLGVAAAVGAAAAAGASFTTYFVPALIVLGALVAAVATAAATLAILVLNVAVAAGLQRGFDRFEAAYDAYRRANNIPDIFYEEMDLVEAAERSAASRA
jgi:hypothetical protein